MLGHQNKVEFIIVKNIKGLPKSDVLVDTLIKQHSLGYFPQLAAKSSLSVKKPGNIRNQNSDGGPMKEVLN